VTLACPTIYDTTSLARCEFHHNNSRTSGRTGYESYRIAVFPFFPL
jgi:hypothetical protein